MILRQDYIDIIKPFINTKTIKILTGVRRCGKSTIFEMLKNELKSIKISEKNIISKNYTDIDIGDNFTAKDMFDDIKKEITNKKKYYLLLDEIQEVDGWEKVINNLSEKENVDIYITGSNSKLMSSEISTYLSGRYVSIPIYTLSFKEFIKFKTNIFSSNVDAFENYIRLGGFPLIAANNFDDKSAYQLVSDIYNSVITRDISRRHNVRKQDLFDKVIRFVFENMGQTFSANSIVKFLKSEYRALSVETMYNYLKWLQDAFIVYKCQRYDIHGKSVLKTQEKYYLSDISLKYSIMGYNLQTVPQILENIVFLELKRRGYNVFIGKIGENEIDFIAENRGEKIYIQVCETLKAQDTRDRELRSLKAVKDNYEKIILTMDNIFTGVDEDGIKVINLIDWLLAI